MYCQKIYPRWQFINDWNLIVVSNQPDISRGRINIELAEHISQVILSHVPLNASYICPHVASENCECRKPKTGLIDRFKQDHPGTVQKMVLVGDRDTDSECAVQAGIDFILRKQNYNISSLDLVDFSVDSLKDLPPPASSSLFLAIGWGFMPEKQEGKKSEGNIFAKIISFNVKFEMLSYLF